MMTAVFEGNVTNSHLFAQGGEWDASVERWRHQFSNTIVIRFDNTTHVERRVIGFLVYQEFLFFSEKSPC